MTKKETSHKVVLSRSEIAERAEKALYLFKDSKPNEIDIGDVLAKVNEALRLIKAMNENAFNTQ